MPTLIELFGDMMQKNGISVQCGENQMLAKISLKGGRKQTVKVSAMHSRYGKYIVVRFQSRVSVVHSAAIIRDLLKANVELDYGAYALDTSVTPHVVDVVYGYVITPHCDLEYKDLFTSIHRVAALADHAEQLLTGGGDVF